MTLIAPQLASDVFSAVGSLQTEVIIITVIFLILVYSESMEKILLYDRKSNCYNRAMKEYWLNRLLTENRLLNDPAYVEALKELNSQRNLLYAYSK